MNVSEEFLDQLQGRVIAQELITRGFLCNLVMDFDDPEAALENLRRQMLASLQHIERPVNEESDAIWCHAADALNREFNQVATRVHNNL